MADFEYGEVMDREYSGYGEGLAGLVNWLGALISVALVAGLAWWGYQLVVRDVTGVPVVRALEGPMRIAPEDPGGVAADHQGLAVNNIAAEGQAAPPADRLVLAPRPTSLQPEDATAGDLAVLSASTEIRALPEDAPDLRPASSAEAGEPQPADQASLIEAALLSAQGAVETPPSIPTALPPDNIIPASVPGVARSPRPLARPAAQAALANAPADAAAAITPADIAPGARLVQLGAFPSPEQAEEEWRRVSEKFAEFMDGKARIIQQAQSGGKDFYRLRVHGFDDLSDARRFCSALLAGSANCIPVVHR